MSDIRRTAYIAIPYNHPDEAVVQRRVETFCRVAAQIEVDGKYHALSAMFNVLLFLHGHKLPTTWEFWEGYSCHMVRKADVLIVVCIDGWQDSTGVRGEIEEAMRRPMQIVCIDEDGNRLPDIEALITRPGSSYDKSA
jgi:hypothetical protein